MTYLDYVWLSKSILKRWLQPNGHKTYDTRVAVQVVPCYSSTNFKALQCCTFKWRETRRPIWKWHSLVSTPEECVGEGAISIVKVKRNRRITKKNIDTRDNGTWCPDDDHWCPSKEKVKKHVVHTMVSMVMCKAIYVSHMSKADHV